MAPSISVFFPAYNDAWTIASLVVSVDGLLREISDDYEILVVNDGSPDHVGEILADLQQHYPRLQVVTHSQNRGYGAALRSGFAQASKDLVFYTDGDAQYDPRELMLLLGAMNDDVDVVNGYKLHRGDGLIRELIGRIYHYGVRLAFGLPIRDVDCDFRLLRRQVLQEIALEGDTGIITVELVKKIQDAGFRFAEVPVHHYPRAAGRSQFFHFARVARTLSDLARFWWRWRTRGAAGNMRALSRESTP